MKILVVQMLRLGDIILSAPALKGLKDQYPECEVHLLINSQFKSVKPLLPYVDKFIGFDRKKMQQRLKHKNVSYYGAFDNLKKLISYLTNEKYDQVINLTHTKFSGYICGLVNSPRTNGLIINQNKKIFGSSFQSLNQHGLSSGYGLRHFTDLYLEGTGVEILSRRILLKETESGFSEIKKQLGQKNIQLLVQPFTSDVKKNWGLDNYQEFIQQYNKLNPTHNIGVMGAPSEKEELQKMCSNLKELNVPVSLIICSLEGALSLIKKASLLVTGDTSIKHIAAATHTRIIELSMGSSHLNFTGVYKKNSFIIQANEPCAPCSHSSLCPFENHPCHSKISPAFLSEFSSYIYARNYRLADMAVRKNASKIKVYKTLVDSGVGWLAVPVIIREHEIQSLFLSIIRSPKFSHADSLRNIVTKIYPMFSDGIEFQTCLYNLNQHLVRSLKIIQKSKNNFDFLLKISQANAELKELIEYQLRSAGLSCLEEIKTAQMLNEIIDKIKLDLNNLLFVVQQFAEFEKESPWQKNQKTLGML